jgi:ATP-dependent helicase/nuclease subunit B
MFRDERMVSPVVITHLAAARLRQFDFAVVVGADREHLAPASSTAIFANEAVRRELGLAGKAAARERLREDLILLISGARRLLFTRQAHRGDEVNLPSPELEVLDMLHELAYGKRLAITPQADVVRGDRGDVRPLPRPAPRLPLAAVPTRLSASAYGSLVACPYQYFARHVLRLIEPDEVSEALAKQDYGEAVHDILHRFHRDHPRLMQHDDATLAARLMALTDEAFAAACDDNFLEHGWRLRFASRIPAYVAWAKEREKTGWLWAEGETPRSRPLALYDGAALELHGRIDRIDRSGERVALLDYKTQSPESLRAKIKAPHEEVQLAFYSLLEGGAVEEAAYVMLDDDKVGTAPIPDVAAWAARHDERIVTLFSDLRQGAALPAHGLPAVCEYCDVGGVCRRPHHAEDTA